MSDFDREAEREKLREQFEAEEEQRQATEQMSELLLKGATMTNAHCSQCGDPIFRYDGQEFCPTCQKPITRDRDEAEDGDGHIEVANPGDEATVQFGQGAEGATEAQGTDAEADAQTADADRQPSPEQGAPETQPESARSNLANQTAEHEANGRQSVATDATGATGQEPTTDPTPSVSTGTDQAPTGTPSTGDVQQDIAAAEQDLARALRTFAAKAAGTDNPRAARDSLEAAREAAEALDALSR